MTTRRSSILGRAEFGPPPAINLSASDQRQAARTPHPSHAGPSAAPAMASAQGPSPAAQADSQSEPRPRLSLRKRLAVLLAVIGVPALAAPGDFGAMAADAPGEGLGAEARYAAQTALPFEQPGESFPGSAFYYLADPPSAQRAAALVALPDSDPLARGGEGGRALGAVIDAGPAARPFMAGQGSHLARAQDCLAKAVWYEAASESLAGQRAVAQVVLNRVAHPSWPGSVCAVVFEGSERRTGCQFSFTCDGSLARRAGGKAWERAQRIASEALDGAVYAPVGHATHYHTLWVSPYWAKSLDHVGTIGAHRFYRNRGSAGQKAAFTDAYTGYEPKALRSDPTAARKAPRLALEPVLEGSSQGQATQDPPQDPAQDLAQNASQPDVAGKANEAEGLADPTLGAAGQAREEFARAGQWKVDPATLNFTDTAPEPAPER
ncbi:MAG: cell wall hydrolase [Pseudomonadota bacterium]